MADMSWWRSWHGAPMDHKWPVIAARSGVKVGIVSAIAWALMDYASQQKDRGSVADFDTEAYAIYSGFSEDEVKAVIQAMTDKGIITEGRLTNWEKRQPKSERSIERVTEWRARHKDTPATPVTDGYAMLHDVAPDKDKEEDTDKDTDKEGEKEHARAFDHMRRLVEQKTGYPIPNNEQEIKALNEMVALDITAVDIDNAIVFFRDHDRIARGAVSLLPSVKTAYAKRVQGQARASPGNNGKSGRTYEDNLKLVQEAEREQRRNDSKTDDVF